MGRHAPFEHAQSVAYLEVRYNCNQIECFLRGFLPGFERLLRFRPVRIVVRGSETRTRHSTGQGSPLPGPESEQPRRDKLAGVKAALQLCEGGPASGALAFVVANDSGAGPAADARIALIVQRVVRDFVDGDIGPDIALGPVGERIDFDQVELGVPLHDGGPGSVRGLVATDRADPGVVTAHGFFQRFDLTNAAALIRMGSMDRPAEARFHRGDALLGALKAGNKAIGIPADIGGDADRLVAGLERAEESVAAMEARFGGPIHGTHPDECCRIRKIEPLKKAVRGYDAWISAIRRDQTPDRA